MYEKIAKGLAGVALFAGAVYLKAYISGVCYDKGEEAKRRWKREDDELIAAAEKAAAEKAAAEKAAAEKAAAEKAADEKEKENE
jgi:hypothetical protein